MSEDSIIERQAFFAAAKRGSVPDLETFKKSFSANEHDELGNTALHYSASANHVDAVKYLVKVGKADVNATNHQGETPLHSAAWRGSLEAIKFLTLEADADHTKSNNQGKRPADFARHLEVRAFLESLVGANEPVEQPVEGEEETEDDDDDETE